MKKLCAWSLVVLLAACGGDDSEGNGGADAGGGQVDAATQMDSGTGGADGGGAILAPVSNAALGQSCTTEQPLGQGDCPDGMICMFGVEGVTPFCTQPCDQSDATICSNGYTGTGIGACTIALDIQGTVQSFCGVVCEGPPSALDCNGACDSTCPGDLACTAELQDAQMQPAGKLCI